MFTNKFKTISMWSHVNSCMSSLPNSRRDIRTPLPMPSTRSTTMEKQFLQITRRQTTEPCHRPNSILDPRVFLIGHLRYEKAIYIHRATTGISKTLAITGKNWQNATLARTILSRMGSNAHIKSRVSTT